MHDRPVLPAELTIYTVGELRPHWLTWLDGGAHGETDGDETLQLDAAEVAEVDAAGVQLLLSLANALALRQRGLRLVRPSRALADACTTLGAAALLAPADDRVAAP